jgi:hypothetical protein
LELSEYDERQQDRKRAAQEGDDSSAALDLSEEEIDPGLGPDQVHEANRRSGGALFLPILFAWSLLGSVFALRAG